MNDKVLILAQIWPEARASAASTRTLSLIDAFQAAGYAVTVSADGKESAATASLREKGCSCVRIGPNDTAFDTWIAELEPTITIFDRFTTEEKFGWRVRAVCPNSLRVLDTIDLHFLRFAREKAFRAGMGQDLSWANLLHFAGDVAPREVAAIYRSDLSLLVSDFERDLLMKFCGVPSTRLQLCRLVYPPSAASPSYAERQGYAMIGTFRHPPNVDAVHWLRSELWPLIRARQPNAQVKVWGSHASSQHLALSNPRQGFYVGGYVEDQFQALSQRRVNLAPLRFGAGIKGKVADAWWSGTPTVAMPLAAEGMHETYPFGGLVAAQAEDFANAAVELYENAALWQESAEQGQEILRQLYSPAQTIAPLLEALATLKENRDAVRLENFTGALLWQQGLRSTEYFSRWIEAKSRVAAMPAP